MASDSSQIETPVCKPTRRSSLFKPTLPEQSLPFNDEIFPPNYGDKLLEENIKWKEAYTNIKSEYLDLRNKANHTFQQSPSVNLENYESYLKKAQDFCCQVSNIVELHNSAIDYLNMRRQDVQKQVEETSKMIREKLNV